MIRTTVGCSVNFPRKFDIWKFRFGENCKIVNLAGIRNEYSSSNDGTLSSQETDGQPESRQKSYHNRRAAVILPLPWKIAVPSRKPPQDRTELRVEVSRVTSRFSSGSCAYRNFFLPRLFSLIPSSLPRVDSLLESWLFPENTQLTTYEAFILPCSLHLFPLRLSLYRCLLVYRPFSPSSVIVPALLIHVCAYSGACSPVVNPPPSPTEQTEELNEEVIPSKYLEISDSWTKLRVNNSFPFPQSGYRT